jgi:DNA-binding transcriptional LysR family regulator
MSIDPRHLIQLAAIADTGSFAQAAERLDLAQSALSRNIKTLEERVGAPVLKRGRRGAIPTEIGAALAQYGTVIRSANTQANSVVTSVGSPRASQLRIAATQLIAGNFLIDPLTSFMNKRAEVSCLVQTGTVDELIEIVTLGEADLALGQFGTLANAGGLHLEPLIKDYLTVVARGDHPLRGTNEPASEILSRVHWIVPRAHTRLRWEIENALKYMGVSSIDITYETPSTAVMMEIVRKSDCVAMVPRFAVSPMIDDGAIIELLPNQTILHRPIGILCQSTKRKSAIINSFCQDLHRFARRAMAKATKDR